MTIARPAPANTPSGLPATTALGSAQTPASIAPIGTPALTTPNRNSATCPGYLHQISNRLNVSLASGGASTKNPGSRGAWGRNGITGTSASAGCNPLQNSPNHDNVPAPSRYGQKLRTRRHRSPAATPI